MRSGHPTAAHSIVLHLPAWNGARQLVSANAGVLHGLHVSVGTGTGFVQVFDAAATTDVTLGTTAPVLSFAVNTADQYFALFDELGLRYMNLGCVIALTTTRTGSTLAAGAVTAYYENNIGK